MAEVSPTEIDRRRVRAMAQAGAQLVEVLSKKQYQQAHLPGAINIPLADLDRRTAEVLQRDEPIIVYCHDFL
jgi:rhodanese-related sulfurtransferase